jgi:hypothetical protein
MKEKGINKQTKEPYCVVQLGFSLPSPTLMLVHYEWPVNSQSASITDEWLKKIKKL